MENQDQVVNDVLPTEQVDANTNKSQEGQEFTLDLSDSNVKKYLSNMMQERVAKTYNSFYTHFNAPEDKRQKNEFVGWLDDRLAKGDEAIGKVESLNGQVNQLNGDLFNAKRELALVRNNVDESRYNDVDTFFRGTNKTFNEADLVEAIKTHPEWLKKAVATISEVGNPKIDIKQASHDEMMKKIFGV